MSPPPTDIVAFGDVAHLRSRTQPAGPLPSRRRASSGGSDGSRASPAPPRTADPHDIQDAANLHVPADIRQFEAGLARLVGRFGAESTNYEQLALARHAATGLLRQFQANQTIALLALRHAERVPADLWRAAAAGRGPSLPELVAACVTLACKTELGERMKLPVAWAVGALHITLQGVTAAEVAVMRALDWRLLLSAVRPGPAAR